MSTSPTSWAIARLRHAGAKVSTVCGHYPEAGLWTYSVTLPPGETRLPRVLAYGLAEDYSGVYTRVTPDGRIIVETDRTPRSERAARASLVAATLHRLAVRIQP